MVATADRRPAAAGGAAAGRYWDGESESSLASALSLPAVECVEARLADRQAACPAGDGGTNILKLTLTTRSAYRRRVVATFVDAIGERVHLTDALRERVHTALQEAVMNAVLHGNLKIKSSLRANLDDLMVMHRTIDELLSRTDVAESAVVVEATWNDVDLQILVGDDGEGFRRPDAVSPEAPEKQIASGRGLAILEAICDRFQVLRGGRAVKMSFNL